MSARVRARTDPEYSNLPSSRSGDNTCREANLREFVNWERMDHIAVHASIRKRDRLESSPASRYGLGSSSGKRTVNPTPPPGWFFALMLPPCASAIWRAT
jgi:hypothetical protein